MERCCHLQVDVNGQEVFFVNKNFFSSFSSKISNLFGNSGVATTKQKLIFHDFPGGAEGFELIARFCYNGRPEMNPANTVLLYCAANYMEINTDGSGFTDFNVQLEESLESMSCWTCSELFVALKQCQDLLPASGSVSILRRLLDSFAGRLALSSVSSSYTSSSDSSRFRFSFDTKNIDTLKRGFSRTSWWFEHLLFLRIDVIEMVVETLVSHKFDHATIGNFLFYYQKSKFIGAALDEKCKVMEAVIRLLCLLEMNSIPCKGLFYIFQVGLCLKISKSCKNKLESLIGTHLDQATLDDLLVPSSYGKDYVYDVSLILRLLKLFLLEGSCSSAQLSKVAGLIDLYAMEVAPDFYLKPSKFVQLSMALPDNARDCHDGIYQAIDMYLEVHGGLCEEEKIRLCGALNCEKLSSKALTHLARNSKFPSRNSIVALVSENFKLKSLVIDTHFVNTFSKLPLCHIEIANERKEDGERILYSKELYFATEKEKLKGNLQGMQWRVMELEKLCRKMKTQLGNIMKLRLPTLNNAKYVPTLCSRYNSTVN